MTIWKTSALHVNSMQCHFVVVGIVYTLRRLCNEHWHEYNSTFMTINQSLKSTVRLTGVGLGTKIVKHTPLKKTANSCAGVFSSMLRLYMYTRNDAEFHMVIKHRRLLVPFALYLIAELCISSERIGTSSWCMLGQSVPDPGPPRSRTLPTAKTWGFDCHLKA